MDGYWAVKPTGEIGEELKKRVDEYYTELQTSGYYNLIRKSYRAYYGITADFSSMFDVKGLRAEGMQGELTKIMVNHYRNLITHLLVMTTAQRPAMEARATNSDYKSLSQAVLATGILDYYFREKKLEKYLKTACEYALVFGEGFVSARWDASIGEQYGVDPDTGAIRYEGDLVFKNHSPLDVIRERYKEWANQDWVICRIYKNKYDLIAKYPEFKDKIENLECRDTLFSKYSSTGRYTSAESDDVAVYEYYHRKSEAVPNGRHVIFLDADIVLFDGPLPYRDIPLYRINPAELIGGPFGYSHTFDLLPLQEAVNLCHSTALSNISTFGVQNIKIPKGADINIEQISGGMNLIEIDEKLGTIEPLQLTATAAETYNYMDNLERKMEMLSGVNQVSRGDPQASLKSGAALALVAAQAVQFNSGLQQSYNMLVEDVGTGVINILRDYAKVPRVAMIAGKFNRPYMKEFSGDDLSQINRVVVDASSAIIKTTAGKVEMANQLLQAGMVKTPDEYITVVNTGRLDPMIEGHQSEMLNIKAENEKMREGIDPIVVITDDHKLHIMEHKAVLANPESREDPKVVGACTSHIMEHINQLRSADPELLTLLGQQSLGQQQQPGPAPGVPGVMTPGPSQEMPEPAEMPTIAGTNEQYQPITV